MLKQSISCWALFLLLMGVGVHVLAESETPDPEDAPNEPQPAPEIESSPGFEMILVKPEPSQGHYLSMGLYYVGAMADDNNRGQRGPTHGLGFSFGLGESVTDWLDLGIAISYAQAGAMGEKESIAITRFTVQTKLYFSQKWFLHGGFGAQKAVGPDPRKEGKERGRYGDVYLLGLGRNLFLSEESQSGGWTLTPSFTCEVGPDREFTTTAIWLGVEFSWWSGFSRDKLDLPLEEAYSQP